MTNPSGKPFEPALHMPVIGPPPSGNPATFSAYYANVAALTNVTAVLLPVTAEVLDPIAFPAPADKALVVTIPNSDASTASGEPPFGTLFAAAGGELQFVPASQPLPLGPNFSQPVKYVPSGQPLSQVGTFVLRIWPFDAFRIGTEMGGVDPPWSLFYLGVVKDSLDEFIGAAIERVYPQTARNVLAFQLTRAGVAFAPQASWDDLRDAYVAAFKDGKVSLLVRAETPIGRAAKDMNAAGNPAKFTFWVQNLKRRFVSPNKLCATIAQGAKWKAHPLNPLSDQLTIWLAAFIPKTIAGYTLNVPDSSGKSMIPAVSLATDCSLTDQRSFDASPTAKSRMRLVANIDVDAMQILNVSANCDTTTELNCTNAKVKCQKNADSSRLRAIDINEAAGLCKFTFDGGASHPCATWAPDINWHVIVEVKKTSSTSVSVELKPGSLVEPFPAFEMYASWKGVTKKLFQRLPNAGADPWNLFGGPSESVTGSVALP